MTLAKLEFSNELSKFVVNKNMNANLLLVKNIAKQECCLRLNNSSDIGQTINLHSGWFGMFWFSNYSFITLRGSCQIYPINLLKLAKLQAFIDEACKPNVIKKCKKNFFVLFEEPKVAHFSSFKEIERWYVLQALTRSEVFEDIVSYIRTTEWYLLVSFLIKEGLTENINISELSEKYGLSGSHFRFLCKQVLGDSIKGQINDWRLANALIEMIRSEANMTDTAYKAGYSSLSHFSTEVKKVMGYSPRGLKKTILS